MPDKTVMKQSEVKKAARRLRMYKPDITHKTALSEIVREQGFSSYDQYLAWCRSDAPHLLDEEQTDET